MAAMKMTRPTLRPDSANAQFRKRIPASVGERLRGQSFRVELPKLQSDETVPASCIITHEVRLSLRTASRPLIALRTATVTAAFERLIAAALAGPSDISYLQQRHILGRIYKQLVAEHEAEPPRPLIEDGREAWSPFEVWSDFIDDAASLVAYGRADRRADAVSMLRPVFDLDAFLSSNAILLSDKSRADLIEALPDILRKAMWTLQARARGDYRSDPVAATFPEYVAPVMTAPSPAAPATKAAPSLTLSELLDRWRTETNPSLSTVSAYNSYRKSFEKFLGHDRAHLVTKADALRWKDHLVKLGRKRINTTFLGGMASLFTYGVDNSETTGITVQPFEKVKARQRGDDNKKVRPFTKAEVSTILAAAMAVPTAGVNDTPNNAALYWVPLLLWSTGARVAELTGLHRSSLVMVDGLPCISIKTIEDGNRVKNAASKRTVPLHADLVALGFVDWIKARPDGALFHKPTKEGNAKVSHPAKATASYIAAWVRGLGITDETVSPSHSWRHTLSTELIRAHVPERVLAAIQGHAPKDIAAGYTHPTVQDMERALGNLKLAEALQG